jgi:hypothetical protein
MIAPSRSIAIRSRGYGIRHRVFDDEVDARRDRRRYLRSACRIVTERKCRDRCRKGEGDPQRDHRSEARNCAVSA